MRRIATLLACVSASAALAADPPAAPPTPGDIVAKAPRTDWVEIPSGDLVQFELGDGRKVVMQLAPIFAPVHVANIKALAKAGWWDGAKIYRVQDNYVVQWGNNEGDKPLPSGVVAKPPAEYARPIQGLTVDTNRDGIDLDACQRVEIRECAVNAPFDDGICLKSSWALGRAAEPG